MNKEEANWNYEAIIEEMRPAPMHSNITYTAMKDLLKERNELKSKVNDLEEKVKLLDNLQKFKHFICQGVLVAMEQNHTYLQLHLTPELKKWCEKEMNGKAIKVW